MKNKYSNWRFVKIGEIGDVIGGGTPPTKNPNYFSGRIPWITPKDLSNHKSVFISRGKRNITQLGLNNSSAKILPKNTVLFTSRAPIGYLAIANNEVTTNQGFRSIICNPKQIYYKFLFYCLKQNKDKIENMASGSTFREISGGNLKNFEILLPPLIEQKKIAEILFSLDSKIELNQQMNKTLESIGQSLFKRWFIDFEFPNEEGKPYRSNGGEMVINSEIDSLVPKGWLIEPLGDTLSLLKDGSHNPPKRTEFGIKFIAGASNIKHFEVDFTKCTYITKNDYSAIHKYWEVKPKDVLLTIVGTVGNVAIVQEKDLPFSLQRSIAILRAGEGISYMYLYFLLNSRRFNQFLVSRLNPTGQPGIYLGTLSEFGMCIPPKEMIAKFDSLVEPIIIQMQSNNSESWVLSQIRDLFLPKFMSGQIRLKVPEV